MRSKEGRDLREWKEGENEGEIGGIERRGRKENEKKSQMLTTNVAGILQN